MSRDQLVWRDPKPNECAGELAVFIADESSYRCRDCGWIGWPQQGSNPVSGVIEWRAPHRKEHPRLQPRLPEE